MIFTIPQPYLQRASGAGIGSYDDAPATDEVDGDDYFGGGNTGGDDDRGGNTGGGDDDRGGNTGGGDDDRGGDDDFGGGSPEGYDSYEFSFNYEDDFFGNDADDGSVPTDFFGTSVIIIVVASRFPYTRMCIPQPFSTLHPPLTYAMRIMCALALTYHGVLLCRVLSCDCMR